MLKFSNPCLVSSHHFHPTIVAIDRIRLPFIPNHSFEYLIEKIYDTHERIPILKLNNGRI